MPRCSSCGRPIAVRTTRSTMPAAWWSCAPAVCTWLCSMPGGMGSSISAFPRSRSPRTIERSVAYSSLVRASPLPLSCSPCTSVPLQGHSVLHMVAVGLPLAWQIPPCFPLLATPAVQCCRCFRWCLHQLSVFLSLFPVQAGVEPLLRSWLPFLPSTGRESAGGPGPRPPDSDSVWWNRALGS